jgi:molybdenum cofactor cytidylyltransferase
MCVVLGAASYRVRTALAGAEVEIIENERWSEGMGTSIACGVTQLRNREIDCLLIALCDQPAIPTSHYESLWSRFVEVTPEMVATEYQGAPGVPAIFSRSMFDELAALQGDRGAKAMLRDPARRVEIIACEAAGIDLDTVSDVEAFKSIN